MPKRPSPERAPSPTPTKRKRPASAACRPSRVGGNPAPNGGAPSPASSSPYNGRGRRRSRRARVLRTGRENASSFLRRQESSRRRKAPQTGRSPVSSIPRGPVIPAKAGTYPLAPPLSPSFPRRRESRLRWTGPLCPQRSNGAHLALKSAHSVLKRRSFSAHSTLIRRSKALTALRPAASPSRTHPGEPAPEVLRPLRQAHSTPSPSQPLYYDTTPLRSATPSAILTPIERSGRPVRGWQ